MHLRTGLALVLVLATGLWSCSGNGAGSGGHHSHRPGQEGEHAHYACPMHPEVVQAEPGNCPKCGMTLSQN